MAYYEQGIYQNVPVTDQGFSESKDKKTPYFFLAIKPGEHERQIQWYIPDGKEDAIDRLLSALETLGFDGGSFSELDPNSSKFWDFTKTVITAECKHEAYNGKQVERWQLPFAGIAREIVPLDSKQVRKLDALFGAKLKTRFNGKRRAATVAPVVAKPQQSIEAELEANPPNDTDVPF